MDTFTHYNRIKVVDGAIADLKRRRKEFIKELIDEKHPLKIGDVVECIGFAYKGKPMVIERVSVDIDNFFKPKWFAYGRIIKKDGSVGKQRGEWFQEIIFS